MIKLIPSNIDFSSCWNFKIFISVDENIFFLSIPDFIDIFKYLSLKKLDDLLFLKENKNIFAAVGTKFVLCNFYCVLFFMRLN